MSNNEFNWSDVIKGVALIAGAAGVTYLAAKGIDQAVNEILESDTNTATSRLIHSVPNMANEVWSMFTANLSGKAQYDRHAQNIYNIAVYVRQSDQKLDDILQNYSVQDGIMMMNGIMANRNDFEQAIFAALLQLKSQTNIKAEAVLGYLKRLGSGG